MAYRVVNPDAIGWITRPHAPDEPARHVAELSGAAGMLEARANLWRYEPGAAGRRHRHATQQEVFVVVEGTLTMYLGEPPERVEVAAGSLATVDATTPVQCANHTAADVFVYVHGWPPEATTAELLDSAVE